MNFPSFFDSSQLTANAHLQQIPWFCLISFLKCMKISFWKREKNSKIANSKVLLFLVLMHFQNLHCYIISWKGFLFQNWLEFFLYIYLVCWLIENNKSCYSFKFSNTYLKNSKKTKSEKSKKFAANVHLLSTVSCQKKRENSNRIKLWVWLFVRSSLNLVSL